MDNGRPAKGHKAGDPICPLVQTGRYPEHPRYAKTEWKPPGSIASTPKIRRGADGKFVSRGKGTGKGKSGNAKPVGTVLAVDADGIPEDYVDPVKGPTESGQIHDGILGNG